ncbi:unnamed protein product [Closterium sp. NIES-54]
MPFVFPDLGLFATVSDLATHLRSLVASYRATCTEAQLLVAPPPIWLTVHWIVTRLPDRLSTARDALLQQHPNELTIDLLKTTLGKIESNLLSVASATDTVAPRLFEGNGARAARKGRREVAAVEEVAVVEAALGAAVVAAEVVHQAEGALEEELTHLLEEVRPAVARGPSISSHSSSSHSRDSRSNRDSSSGRHHSSFSRGDPHCSGVRSSTGSLRHSGDLEDLGALAAAAALTAGPLAPRSTAPAPATTGASPDRAVPVSTAATTTLWRGASAASTTSTVHAGVAASPQVPVSSPVAVSGQVEVSGQVAASCSCRSLAHPTVLWHHRLGHLLLPRLHSMASHSATPHSSSLRPATAPFQTLHLDVWGPAPILGPERERYFLVVVDDYSRYTAVFAFAKKYEVNSTLIRWLLATEGTCGSRVRCLHSDRGGEFRSGVLTGFCGELGIRQSWMLQESPQQNGVAERRIGLAMDIARTSMIHAHAPHFLWPYALRYAAHQLNLQPRVSRPEVSPTSLWTGSPGCLALVRDTSADKLSARAIPCVFLGFLVGSPDYHQFLDSLTVDSVGVGAGGAATGGTRSGSARSRGVGTGGAGTSGASSGGAGAGGAGTGGASSGGAGAGGAGTGGASSGGAGAGGTGTGGTSFGGAGAGGAGTGGARSGGTVGAGPGEMRAGRSPTASPTVPPHRHDTPVGPAAAAAATAAVAAAAAAAAAATAVTFAAAIPSSEWPSGPWFSFLSSCSLTVSSRVRYYVSASGLDSGCFLSSSVTVSSSCCPARLDESLSSTCSALVSSCRPPHRLVSFSSSSFSACVCSPLISCVVSHPITDYYNAARPVVSRVLASLVTDPRASSSSVSALFVAVADFASTRRLDHATRVVAAPPPRPLSIGGESSLGCDVLEDRQFELEFLAAASPSLCAMLLSLEGDPGALDIPTPRTYRKAGRLHEEIWLRRLPGFTDTFPPGTQWILRRPVYGLHQSPREWHDTLRSTLRDLGFRPSSVDPSLFVCTGSTPFFILVYVDDLVFATADRAAMTKVKSKLQKRQKCTDLGELQRYLGLQITRDRAAHTITLTQSHMVQQVLRRFGFQFSTTQPTPLADDHRLIGPFPDEPFESCGPYAELVGCLMYMMTCTRPDLTFPLSVLSSFVATGRHRPVHWTAGVRVAKYLATTSGMGLVLGGTQPVVLTGHCDSSYADDVETQRSTQGYYFSLGAGAVSWRSTRSFVASSSAEAEIYAGAMAAQELRWLTFLLADLGERPCLAPTLYADNKAMILLC